MARNIDDRILAYLEEARDSGPNPTNIPTSLELLSRDLKLDSDVVRQHCDRLSEQGIVERFEVGMIYYRLPSGAPQNA